MKLMLMLLKISNLSTFKKKCFGTLIKVLRSNVYLDSLSLFDICLNRLDPNRDKYMNDKYYDTTESDLGTSIACHPSIYTVKLSFKDTRDSTVKALIHPFHRIITLQ